MLMRIRKINKIEVVDRGPGARALWEAPLGGEGSCTPIIFRMIGVIINNILIFHDYIHIYYMHLSRQ